MCEFISWIEKNGGILCLTDREVFSEEGREKLKGCLHNDVIGHGAIRVFYEITGGTDKEVRDFWNVSLLPKELADKLVSIKEFDKHWGQMFRAGHFQNDDLRRIIVYAPNEWRGKAWKQLLKQKPGDDDLRRIIMCAPNEWKEKARKLLIG